MFVGDYLGSFQKEKPLHCIVLFLKVNNKCDYPEPGPPKNGFDAYGRFKRP